MFIAIAVLLAGSIAEITVNNWQGWLGGAMLIRLGVGLAQSVLVTYLSELAPFQIRGLLIGSYQLMLAFGQLIVAVAAQLITIHQPTKYKPLIALEFLFTGVHHLLGGYVFADVQALILMIGFVPESHIYYARKGQHENAKRSMTRLYGTAADYDVVCQFT